MALQRQGRHRCAPHLGSLWLVSSAQPAEGGMKKTPWFGPQIRPVRAGVYETRWPKRADHPLHPQYQHWDGLVWSGWASSIDAAELNAGNVSIRQQPQWRGLAKEPK